MRVLLYIILIISCFSCGKREARRPITQNSGSYITESVERNKELIAKEEAYIEALIKNDTLRSYESSPNGFWFTYKTQIDSIYKPTAKVGDLVLFTYNIATLRGKTLLTKEEIGNTVTQIDQSNQELISGIREGLKLMKEGETITFIFPSHKAYGYYGLEGKVKSNTPIQSTVTLLEIKPQTEN